MALGVVYGDTQLPCDTKVILLRVYGFLNIIHTFGWEAGVSEPGRLATAGLSTH